MRTRKEQIDSLYHGHNRYSTITQDAFRNHLIEAERRAEQRVRAELAQAAEDADRLLWLAKIHTPECEEYVKLSDFRAYIDGQRAWEVLMDMGIKFSDDVKYELFGNGGSDTTP